MPYHIRLSRWLYEREVADAAWVAYVPHRSGLPAVVDEVTHALLHMCEQGADVDEVIRRARSRFPATTSDGGLRVLIAACTALGFLTDQPEPSRFCVPESTRTEGGGLSVWLQLTSHCNLECSYCFVEKTDRDMSMDTLERAVGAIVATAVERRVAEVDVRLGGGEPTIVLPLVERAHDLLSRRLEALGVALRTRVVTNGTRVDDRLLAFLKRPGVAVAVSLDGHGASHDRHRTFKGTARGSWTLVSDNVDRLLAAGADVAIAATLSEDSCPSLPQLIRWTVARSLPVHLQCVSEPKRPWSAGTPSPDDYRVFNERLIASLDETFCVLERRLARGEAVPELSIDQLSVDAPRFDRCCGIGASYVTITEAGEVALCPTLARARRTALADDLIGAASTLLHRSPACRNDRDDDPCLACQWFPACVGGCAAINQWVNGDEFSISPLCAFRRHTIPRFVEYLGRRLLFHARREGIERFRLLHPARPERSKPGPSDRALTIA